MRFARRCANADANYKVINCAMPGLSAGDGRKYVHGCTPEGARKIEKSPRQNADMTFHLGKSGRNLCEATAIEIIDSLNDFSLAIHHERSVSDDFFIDRLSA